MSNDDDRASVRFPMALFGALALAWGFDLVTGGVIGLGFVVLTIGGLLMLALYIDHRAHG